MRFSLRFLIVFHFILFPVKSMGQEGTIEYDGLERAYHVHCPSYLDGSSSVPLVIALHGGGSSRYSIESRSGLSLTADDEGFIVVYPDAATGGWNAGGSHGNTPDDVGFISALIDTLSKEYTIDASRIYATGFSLGSLMTYRLGAELSEKIAAIAPVAGQMAMEDIHPDRAMPIIHFQDPLDPRVPYYGEYTDQGYYFPAVDSVINMWIEINGCDTNPDTIYNHDGIIGRKWSARFNNADIILYTLFDVGHNWPRDVLPASDFMWDFFMTHPLPSASPSPYFIAELRTGHAPLIVQFTDISTATQSVTAWEWDFDHDHTIDSHAQHPQWTYTEPGMYTVSLDVSCDPLSQIVTRQNYIHVFDGNSALHFDGWNSCAVCPSSYNLTEALTIEAWIYPTGCGEMANLGFGRVLDKGKFSLFLIGSHPAYADHSVAFQLIHAGNAPSLSSTQERSISLYNWQHVAVTYDGTTSAVKMYINGIEQALVHVQPPSGSIMDNSSDDVFIGNDYNRGFTFDGIIDEARLWSAVRNREEICANMRSDVVGTEPNLIGYWKMDEGSGESIQDYSTHGNDGVVDDVTWRHGIPLDQIFLDVDEDGIRNCADNCPHDYNPAQEDLDDDYVGDVCDNCSDEYNPDQRDSDQDGIGNACDVQGGDVNEDGGTNVLDVVITINHILGIQPLEGDSFGRADCDNDGTIDILDALGIVNVILGLGECTPSIVKSPGTSDQRSKDRIPITHRSDRRKTNTFKK